MKNYFKRYIWLVETIRSHGHITFKELEDAWYRSSQNDSGDRLSHRTFNNHIESIRDIFEIDIQYQRPQGYYIADSSEADEIKDWMLDTLSVTNRINESKDLHGRILLENIPSGRKYLTAIMDAMSSNRTLLITYMGHMDKNPYQIEVEPYCLKVFKQRWYALCRVPSKNILSIYSLDRISSLETLETKFKMQKGFSASEYFRDYFGIVHAPEDYPPQKILLKVWWKQRAFFRTLPLHHTQQEIEINDEWSIFEYYMSPSWDLEMELLQYNDWVEVLEPTTLRDMMIDHAWNIKNLYGE